MHRINALILSALVAAAANPAAAQALQPVNNLMDQILDTLTGPLGVTVATIGLVLVGFLFFMGRIHWGFLAAWIVGATLVFFGRDIVAALTA